MSCEQFASKIFKPSHVVYVVNFFFGAGQHSAKNQKTNKQTKKQIRVEKQSSHCRSRFL
jgi:hypothetical protein